MPATEFVTRLGLAGPLLYIGLHMVLEPVKFLTTLHMFACVLQDFEHRFEVFRRNEPIRELDSQTTAPHLRLAVRVTGMALALLSLLLLTGLAG